MVEKMFLCPKCAKQFEEEHFKGVCPDCGYTCKILYLWINPKYKLIKVPKKRGRYRK